MKKYLLFWPILLLTTTLMAQRPVRVAPQDNVKLSWPLTNLSIIDGGLYGYSDGLRVTAGITDGRVSMFLPDTLAKTLGAEYNYVVRHPQDSLLYYTIPQASGERGGLYVHTDSRFHPNRQVDERSWDMEVHHPTFSPNGSIMIFSSQQVVGLGGYDLWCSFWNGKRWTKPLNLGNVVNTAGNEVDPVFYGNYLIYASSLPQQDSLYDFYAVYIQPSSNIDSILFGTYRKQRLPEPINSKGSDRSLAIESSLQRGYWISDRSGRQELYSFEGRLDGVMLKGVVADEKGRPVAAAEVEVQQGGRQVGITTSDAQGRYQLFVQPGKDYQLVVRCPDYYHYRKTVSAIRTDEHYLVSDNRQDITLSYLPLNQVLVFDRIYGAGVEVELSDEGQRTLAPLANFLRDNPQVSLELELQCHPTDDSVLNNLVTERRISNLQQYFYTTLPERGQISYRNGTIEPKNTVVTGSKNTIFAIFRKDTN